ncbi:MAG: hypothetical protein JNM99_22230 [Verrucomicrobiaceae bacterium]|nr:hypothetical protein [Verrucomicrobiaceae bacterium]
MARRHSLDYEPVFSSQALEVFLSLSKARQRKLAKVAYALAAPPFREPDYHTKDSTGRLLSNVRVDGFIFTYWLDRSPMELRIVDLVEL